VSAPDPLGPFSPAVRAWFERRVGVPTEAQRLAWPEISAGRHVLLTAPTGSGKTLAAFLWAIDRLATGVWETGATRVLYVSPLKALGNDIRRNLLRPLEELPEAAAGLGQELPTIRVASRTGDTPEPERRRMVRQPPELLVTTPESLNILLTSRAGRRLLGDLETVILDEVHAVIGSKRGVHLITAVERLVDRAGEVQRIALSATVHPPELVARWVGGFRPDAGGEPLDRRRRTVHVVRTTEPKAYRLEVTLPVDAPDAAREADDFWSRFADRLKPTLRRNRSTLVFGNSRRTVEKLARFLNEGESRQLAWSHHGALSREIRQVVEERLKAGRLPAIVATSSLELGIDIGAIDEVVMVQTPPSVAAAVQRLGRSGHGVGETSRGRIVPLNAAGLLEAAVVCRAVLDGDIEPVRPVAGALDVLAQVVLSMTVERTWRVDELYDAVRRSEPYHGLPRRQFDLVLDLLAGRYATTRLRGLHPRVTLDPVDGTVRARPGAERLLYLAGGTIPDRGYYHLRMAGTGAPIGQLDEEFVWERAVGDSFTLGVQSWKIERITHNDVLVAPIAGRAAMAPFWRADERDRSAVLSDRIAGFLESVEGRLDDDDLATSLARSHHLEAGAAAELVRLLREQRAATGALPHRRRVVVEHTAPPAGRGRDRQVVIHTMWGGTVNRPLAYALSTALERRLGVRPDVLHGDDCVAITWPSSEPLEDPLATVAPAEIDELLRERLEHTGFFGARFREAAGCALVLPRSGPRRRTPLWVHRQRAKELLDGVAASGDFPLVLEAWRSCLQDDLEVEVLLERLHDVREGRIEVVETSTETPSPFAAQVLWRQTNRLMYEDDAPAGAPPGGRLRPDLVREVALSGHLRPRVSAALVTELEGRLQRTATGYAPGTGDELLDWLRERGPVPSDEWGRLLEAAARDHGADPRRLAESCAVRVLRLRPGDVELVCIVDALPRLLAATGASVEQARPLVEDPLSGAAASRAAARLETFAGDRRAAATGLVDEWLRFCGPIPPERLATILGLDPPLLDGVLGELVEAGTVVLDELRDDATAAEACDRENLERLLRLARAGRRPGLQVRPAVDLPLFLALHHGLGTLHADPSDLEAALERLVGWAAPAGDWETELLPARLDPYLPAWLDALLADTDLAWIGCGPERLTFALPDELPLLGLEPAAAELRAALDGAFPHALGRFSLDELARFGGGDSAALARLLWRAAWAGAATADSFAPVRRGLAGGFEPETPAPRSVRSRRGRFHRWRATRPFQGAWYRLPEVEPPEDPLAADELGRDRARLLLDRHGVVFRTLVERELPGLGWRTAFRSLRLLELAGEAVAGRFFDGVGGLQFASHDAVRSLGAPLPADRVWWIAATDPASPCGLGVEGLDGLPRRVAGAHLVFHGRTLVLVSGRRGARLEIRVPADHPRMADYLAPLRSMVGRGERPVATVEVETVNGEPAPSSAYRAALEAAFHVTRTPTTLRLGRRY